MNASGHLAGVYWEAVVLNVFLMIPLEYLVLLHFLCGDEDTASPEEGKAGEAVITDCDSSRVNAAESSTTAENRTFSKNALRKEMICIITSLAIEVTREITKMGMFDINDILANSIGSCIGIGMVCLSCVVE